MKTYGNEPTNLRLSEKAQALYNESDPVKITEKETEKGFLYDVDFCGSISEDCTEEQVNQMFEEMFVEIHSEPVTYCIVDDNGTVHAESTDRKKLEMKMHDIFTDEEIEKNGIEIL